MDREYGRAAALSITGNVIHRSGAKVAPDAFENCHILLDFVAGVTVTADEHLAGAAGDLTLGELVAMLGRRADGLARLWNDWGRVRPLLLEIA